MPKKETVHYLVNKKLSYSPVIKIGNHYHFSGVIPKLVDVPPRLASPGSFEEQAIEVFEKIDDLLKECGLTRDDIFETTVMLVSKDDFQTMDILYRKFFAGIEILPERAACGFAWLPFGSKIEIRFIAIKQG